MLGPFNIACMIDENNKIDKPCEREGRIKSQKWPAGKSKRSISIENDNTSIKYAWRGMEKQWKH